MDEGYIIYIKSIHCGTIFRQVKNLATRRGGQVEFQSKLYIALYCPLYANKGHLINPFFIYFKVKKKMFGTTVILKKFNGTVNNWSIDL